MIAIAMNAIIRGKIIKKSDSIQNYSSQREKNAIRKGYAFCKKIKPITDFCLIYISLSSIMLAHVRNRKLNLFSFF